ncbi:MAG TPA: hypothetical protein PKX16_09135 [Kiritimatiellia bacterium]|nr:hypothetical protein [Kiritimatiellia bacterium]
MWKKRPIFSTEWKSARGGGAPLFRQFMGMRMTVFRLAELRWLSF